MKAYEHRGVGDAATAGAVVNLGGDSAADRFELSFGDVVALSGDFFRPEGWSISDPEQWRTEPSADPAGSLFSVAGREGVAGTRLDTRDEIVCALKVSTLDEAVVDSRFEPGGRFADFAFSPGANRSDVERRVRDRYLALAAVNDDHFAAPGPSDVATGSGFGSAVAAYRHLHQVALDEAWRLGARGGAISRATAREAAAQHYLTDAFAAGHLRTPVASIRRYWKARYPSFWEQLQRKVAADTAAALRELSRLMRLLPHRFVYGRTFAELTRRTSQYPELSLGDLVARAFHDWDNSHGLQVDGGVIFGDGHIEKGETTRLAVAAVRAGIDDVEVAFRLGASGSRVNGPLLYEKVRQVTGAEGGAFFAEEKVPRLLPGNPHQN
ncbi:MAG: hypothetical protein LC733_09000 [Actinobacteria bacterium]|nr:hypothetical protein [Actinomycetota bacterium]